MGQSTPFPRNTYLGYSVKTRKGSDQRRGTRGFRHIGYLTERKLSSKRSEVGSQTLAAPRNVRLVPGCPNGRLLASRGFAAGRPDLARFGLRTRHHDARTFL